MSQNFKLERFLKEQSTQSILGKLMPIWTDSDNDTLSKILEKYENYSPTYSMLERNTSSLLKETIIKLSKNPNLKFVFGGSIAAAGLDLLDREIKDIDLFIINDVTFSKLTEILVKSKDSDFENYGSETTTDVNGKEIKRYSFNTTDGEVSICVFVVDELSYSQTMFFGNPIRLMSINDVITAKVCYSKKECKSQQKHKDDLKEIYNNLYKLAQ